MMLIFDPFCGSGVTLLESAVRGHDSIGFDINPLALLIAKTKTPCLSEITIAYGIQRFKGRGPKQRRNRYSRSEKRAILVFDKRD